jgi:hypothetical protein
MSSDATRGTKTMSDRARRPYEPPKLETLGNAAEITRQVTNMGTNDGGMGMTKRS